MNNRVVIRCALLSVSDKTGIEDFARSLDEAGVRLLSTGGTARLLKAAGITITEVSDHTGFPEIMDGRVKTLHPLIHGGILGRRGIDDEVMALHGIQPIDLVVVNLYPFRETIATAGASIPDAIENIDIGGPALLRAAAKNHAFVGVVVSPGDYDRVRAEIADGGIREDTRVRLAAKAFAHSADYDGTIADFLSRVDGDGTLRLRPRTLHLSFGNGQELRYGENPHQSASLYQEAHADAGSIARARLLQGKPLSFNNIVDADAALACVRQFGEGPACVIVKHANPCGVAVAQTSDEAYERAFATDPESAFGGVIALNRDLDAALARRILERQFVEVIAIPGVSEGALAAAADKPNVRVLVCAEPGGGESRDYKRISGGLLVQDADDALHGELETVSGRAPEGSEWTDLLFAWRVAKFVKSNAIVYARHRQTVGIGAGQMSRVNSARIAAIKAAQAGIPVRGAVMASDAFFPFRDAVDTAAAEGITAIIQPGGSVRDHEVVEAANAHDIAMVFTHMRHFRH